ncbi:MAG: hypothetical protein ABSE62_16730 [Chthoniobacteraceae bacterium]|jgi:hypothetical protein
MLAAGGYPFPYVDDPYYIGAGLNLGAGGGLANPLLENTAHFYGYPPLYSFLMAGWLKLFGVSASSMVGLYLFMAWLGTLCVVRAFQILNKEFLGWMVAFGYITYLTCFGMRPDAFGLCFAAISFRSGVSGRPGVRYLSPLFAFLALGTLPATLAIMIPWLIWLTATHRRMWMALLAGGAAAALVSCAMIKWQVGDFLSGLTVNNHVAQNEQTSWVKANWDAPMGLIKIVYPVAGASLAILLKGLRQKLQMIDALMLLSVLLCLYTILHTVSGHRIMGLITLIVLGYYIESLVPSLLYSRILVAANSLLIIGSGLRPLVQGVTTQRTADGPALLRKVESIHPSRIIVDEWSLRYVFDYHLRPGMIAVGFSARPHGHEAKLSVKYPDECWVLSAESVKHYQAQQPHGIPIPRYVSIAGRQMGSWVSNAGEIGISPPGQ